jgi:hypothetical protein
MSFLEIALSSIARGWHVFPCWPQTKKPLIKGGEGWKNASNDEKQVRSWWEKWPDANVAVACGPSNLAVFDIDHGLNDHEGFVAFTSKMNLPETYAVRTGRRDDYGVQVYFSGAVPDVGDFRIHGCNGQIKSAGGYVMAEACIHPISKERYERLQGHPDALAPMPDNVRALQSYKAEVTPGKPMERIPEGAGRHAALTSFAGTVRHRGFDEDAILAQLIPANDAMCEVPVGLEDLEHIAHSVCRYAVPEPVPEVVIGSKPDEKKVTDWRELFHSKEDAINAPPITFLIKDFLQREGVTAVAGPVRERKSLIALNICHALLTGERLFDYFEVIRKPERVLYLCPEVSLGPFTDRLKKIGLLDYVGETLFYRTLSADGTLKLDDPALQSALPGSVVILDTAVRFFEGDENSSQDARIFADSIFALLRAGAESVVMLHHSPKGNGDGMTLENAMRGSGDFGAFLACCWGTKLQDPAKPYESASFLSNLKQRDFESKDFEVTGGPDCRLHIVGDPSERTVTLQSRKGNKGNKDGKDEAAEAIIRARPEVPVRKLQEELAALGIQRGTTWISKARARIQIAAGEAVLAG